MNPYKSLDKAVTLEEEDKKISTEQQIRREIESDKTLGREIWLENPVTGAFIMVLEARRTEIEDTVNRFVIRTGSVGLIMTALMIESQTLKRVINYARTGRYETD
jgi:hypothetical protein